MNGPLSHIRVLDLSRVLAGPWASQLLADLGADVIKVERPGSGDDTRAWGPPYLRDEEGRETSESGYFLSTNRGKRSVAIDISTDEGQALVRALVAHCDVVVENFKAGGLARYGLDYLSLKDVRADLIYCAITGFGQDGPYRDRPGYDFMVQAMGGLMSLTGHPDEEPGGGPVKVGVAITDIFTGLYAAAAILAALIDRECTKQGRFIDLALLDVQVAVLANQAMNYLVSGRVPPRLGNAHPNIVPYQAFATVDGHMVLAIGNDAQFARFCALAGRQELATDSRFATNAGRVRHRQALLPEVAAVLAGRTTSDWLAALERAKVPCAPINDLAGVFADPQVRFRGLLRELTHPDAGRVKQVANPIRIPGLATTSDRPPPLLGQHTKEVLGELLGLSCNAFARLQECGVLGAPEEREPLSPGLRKS